MISLTTVHRIIPLIAGMLIAMIPMEATPFMISGVMDTARLTAEQAGWIATACIASVAVASIFFAPLVARIPFRTSMLCAAFVVGAAYAVIPVLTTFPLLVVDCVLIGGGAGTMLAGMAVAVAAFEDPDRIYGTIYASTGIVFAGLLYVLPATAAAYSSAAMFGVLTLLVVLVSCALWRLPRHVHDSSSQPVAAEPIRWGPVAIVVAALVIGQPFYGGTYGFAERKALEVGLTSVQGGMALSGATLLTIVGTLIVAVVGTRWGRLLPTVTVLGLATFAYYLVLGARTPAAYLAGILLFGFVQLGMNSYLFGLASALDRSGRVSAALQGFSLIPYGLGPGVFGSIVGSGSLRTLAGPAVAFNVFAIILLVPLLLSLDRRRPVSGAAA